MDYQKLFNLFKLPKDSQTTPAMGGNSGIALFMVIGAMTVLSLLVTEFTYIAQINQRMAYDSLDQLQAHYVAKTGFKLSLLRLKGYQQVKKIIQGMGDASGAGDAVQSMVPKGVIEKIWNFPFIYPIPTSIPGLMPSEREQIENFQKNSGIPGKFSASITSESSKYNLNSILASFAAKPKANTSPTPTNTTENASNTSSTLPDNQPSPNPSTQPSFSPEVAREALSNYIGNIIENKFQADPDFAKEYIDFRLEDFMDNLISWADHTYEKRGSARDSVTPKHAPFYSVSELRFIPPLDDTLYDLIAPQLTAAATPGINVNTMKEETLRALISGIRDEEVSDFFKFRDSSDEDNLFKKVDDFYKYLQKNISQFSGSDEKIKEFKEKLTKSNIQLVTDENQFKITVTATVNRATRVLEAYVTLSDPKTNSKRSTLNETTANNSQNNNSPATPQNSNLNSSNELNDTGLNVTFMRIF